MWVLGVQSSVSTGRERPLPMSPALGQSFPGPETGGDGAGAGGTELCVRKGEGPSANTCTQAEVSQWSPAHSRFSGPQSL